jgi:hypothetical protein
VAKSREQVRQANSDRMKAYWAAKKAREASQQQTAGATSEAGPGATPAAGDSETEGLQVTVKSDETPKPQLSLKDRFMQKFGQPSPTSTASPAKKPAGRAKKSENLISSAMPSVVAAFIATYSQDMLQDPYKPCAPSKDEVSGIIGPLFDVLGREIEVTGKASQNTIDLINSLLCAMMYGLRAFVTYKQIKNQEYPANEAEAKARAHQTYLDKLNREAREYDAVANEPGPGSYPTSPFRAIGGSSSSDASSAPTHAAKNDAERLSSGPDDDDTERGNNEADLISSMFARDKQGRVRLGLLPTTV